MGGLATEVGAKVGLDNQRTFLSLEMDSVRPYVQNNAYVAPSATVIGDVTINDASCVMNNCVLRGDYSTIQVGAHTLLEENCVLATSSEGETTVGDHCFVGAGTVMDTCSVGNQTIIGDACVIEEGVEIGSQCRIESQSVITSGTQIPAGELWAGRPAVFVRSLSAEETATLKKEAEARFRVTAAHMYEFLPHGTVYQHKEQLITEGAIHE